MTVAVLDVPKELLEAQGRFLVTVKHPNVVELLGLLMRTMNGIPKVLVTELFDKLTNKTSERNNHQ